MSPSAATNRSLGSSEPPLTLDKGCEAVAWDVAGFNGMPAHLAAVGLGLFAYKRGVGDETRGDQLLQVLAGRPVQT